MQVNSKQKEAIRYLQEQDFNVAHTIENLKDSCADLESGIVELEHDIINYTHTIMEYERELANKNQLYEKAKTNELFANDPDFTIIMDKAINQLVSNIASTHSYINDLNESVEVDKKDIEHRKDIIDIISKMKISWG